MNETTAAWLATRPGQTSLKEGRWMAHHDYPSSYSEKVKGTPGETAAPTGARPVPLPVNAEGIPAELRSLSRWVAWGYTTQQTKRGTKWTKVPVDPKTGRSAKVNDPSTWG